MMIKLIFYLYLTPPTADQVLEECIKQNLLFPKIVTAQAILETGHFTSYSCRIRHNLFGLYDSKKHELMTFDTWRMSITRYKALIQTKYYKEGDYYKFLDCMWKNGDTCKRYAQASEYVKTLKLIKL